MDKKKETPKKEKIATGVVRTNEKTGLSKAFEGFFARDLHEAGEYIWHNIAIPKLRIFVDEFLTSAIHAMTGGNSRTTTSSNGKSSYNYNSRYVSSSRDRDDYRRYEYDRADYNYRDITFESRGDAERVLDILRDDLEEYKTVSVSDLYDRAGVAYNNRQGRKYGWCDLRGSDIISVQDGWAIKMPPVMPLD